MYHLFLGLAMFAVILSSINVITVMNLKARAEGRTWFIALYMYTDKRLRGNSPTFIIKIHYNISTVFTGVTVKTYGH
jgi:hypothetical protein